MELNILKIIAPTTIAFCIGIFITPILTKYFYKYKMWKKSSRLITNDEMSKDFQKIHLEKAENSTPRIGGIIIWLSLSITIITLYLISLFFPNEISTKLSFLSRNQTLIPFFALLAGAMIGLMDDVLQIIGKSNYAKDDTKYRYLKILILILIGLGIGVWFYFKLGVSGIDIPFGGFLNLGILFIPAVILVVLAVFSSSVIDGIDGLSGGVLASIFASYATMAFLNNQLDIAAFCGAITGSILAFLWFNIPPARFYMGETGMLGLTVVLAVVAFLTDTVLLLPIIALPLVITSASVIIQMVSKKYFKKKVFKVAPIHHHFEALGWSSHKVTMRFWIISVVCAISGVILSVIS